MKDNWIVYLLPGLITVVLFVAVFIPKTRQNDSIEPLINSSEVHEGSNLPNGYTLDSYSIEEITNVSCSADSDCETRASYLVQSRCPFTSLCVENKCAVVCPSAESKAPIQ